MNIQLVRENLKCRKSARYAPLSSLQTAVELCSRKKDKISERGENLLADFTYRTASVGEYQQLGSIETKDTGR